MYKYTRMYMCTYPIRVEREEDGERKTTKEKVKVKCSCICISTVCSYRVRKQYKTGKDEIANRWWMIL